MNAKRAAVAVTGAGVLVLGGGVAFAGSAAGPRTYTGCVGAKGVLRVINPARSQRCLRGEQKIIWNKTGPAGARGPVGARGPAGARGPKGDPGPGGGLGRVTRRSTTINMAPGGQGSSAEARCEAGEVATGGGYSLGTLNVTVRHNQPLTDGSGLVPVAWTVTAFNHESFLAALDVYVICVAKA